VPSKTVSERVVIAVDPHKTSWTAAAVSSALAPLATLRTPVSRQGYRQPSPSSRAGAILRAGPSSDGPGRPGRARAARRPRPAGGPQRGWRVGVLSGRAAAEVLLRGRRGRRLSAVGASRSGFIRPRRSDLRPRPAPPPSDCPPPRRCLESCSRPPSAP